VAIIAVQDLDRDYLQHWAEEPGVVVPLDQAPAAAGR
jgi:hypothetical protein